MQILLGLIAGAVIGTAAHFSLDGRDTRGAALLPIIGTFSAGLAWMLLTWLGLGIDSPWLWLSALVVPAVVTFPVGILVTKLRRAHDERERERLKIA